MNTSSLKHRGEMFDKFMSSGSYNEKSNVKVGSIICVNIAEYQLQDVLSAISKGVVKSYLNGLNGKINYEYDPDNSKFILLVWGHPEFLTNILSPIKL